MPQTDYLTVGQLAQKAGVTVRALQYYDQQGLLSPSAKGINNQRLYAPEDEEALYRILTLKYLGLSLADIGQGAQGYNDTEAFRALLTQTLASLEDDFQGLIKRLSVLRTLINSTEGSPETDWAAAARNIEEGQQDREYFWQMAGVGPEEVEAARPDENERRGIAVGNWHELIADTIRLRSTGVAPADPQTAELAARLRQLEAENNLSLEQTFVFMENIAPHRGGSFEALRQSVSDYLAQVGAAHPD